MSIVMPHKIFGSCYNYDDQKVNQFYASYSSWIDLFNEKLKTKFTSKSKRDGSRILSITMDCKCGARTVGTTLKVKQKKKIRINIIQPGKDIVWTLKAIRVCKKGCGKIEKMC